MTAPTLPMPMVILSARLKKLALFAGLYIAVPLVLLEILLVLLDPYLFRGFYVYDPDLGFRVRSHAQGSNRFGFNDRDYEFEQPPNVDQRILFLGDSFSWAGGQTDNYTVLLEQALNQRSPDSKIELINAGYPMTHTGEQLALLKKYGLQYNPDLVVLGFFAGNDFFDADPYRKRIVVNGIYIDVDRRKSLSLLGYPLVPKSRLWLFLQQQYTLWQELQQVRQDAEQQETETETEAIALSFSQDTYLEIQRARSDIANRESQASGQYDRNIDYILQQISAMHDLLEQRGIKFAVAIYPDEFQVNAKVQAQLFAQYPELEREQFQWDLPQTILKEHLEREQIPYLDLLADFRAREAETDLYIPRNTHWNTAGNEFAAQLLLPFIEAQL